MKHFFALGLMPFLFALGFLNNTTIETADITSSEITWKGYKVTGSHDGTVNLKTGSIEFDDNGNLTGGMITIDMTSIKTTDLSGESAQKLEGHLKSDDFFGVEKNPTATLKITSVSAKGTPGDFKVTGDLSIKGKTKSVKFYTNIMDKDGSKVATADLKIDRSDYDIRYGSGSFFANLGNKTIYDEFDIKIKLVLK